MGRLPCLGDLLRPQKPRQVAKKNREEADLFLLSHPSSKSAKQEPSSRRNPYDHWPYSSDPGVTRQARGGPGMSCLRRPAADHDEGSPRGDFRGSIAQRLIGLATLRRGSHPPRKTRFRRLARLYRTGLVTRRVPLKGFERKAVLLSRASWRNVSSFFSRVAKVAGEPLTAYNGRRNTSEEAPHAQTTTFTTTTATGPLSDPHPDSPRLP